MNNLIFGKRVIDKELFDKLEELLISADMGPQFTYDLIDDVKQRVSRNDLQNAQEIKKDFAGTDDCCFAKDREASDYSQGEAIYYSDNRGQWQRQNNHNRQIGQC